MGETSGSKLAWISSSKTCPDGTPRLAAVTRKRRAESTETRAVIGIHSSCRFILATIPPSASEESSLRLLSSTN